MEKQIEILRIEKLTKYYKCQNEGMFSSISDWISNKHDVGIENISFSVCEGETLGITGQGHCGKSTLLKLISGLLTPTSGHILYKGIAANDEKLKKISSYVSMADITLDNRLTLMENIVKNFNMYEDRSKLVDKAEEVLNTFMIKEYEFRELRMVPNEVKRALPALIGLISTKSLLCIDQPFKHITSNYHGIYINELKKMADKGKTIIISSSSKDDLNKVCNRIIEI